MSNNLVVNISVFIDLTMLLKQLFQDCCNAKSWNLPVFHLVDLVLRL